MDQLTDNLPRELADALPDEIRQYIDLQKANKLNQIAALGQAVAKKRDEAVQGRSGSGIEQEWTEDTEAYMGVDDANRGEAKSYKPLSHTGATIIPRRDPTRSTVFLNITRPYTDAAAARVSDMLLPTDDRNWAIKPTPIAEMSSPAPAGMLAGGQVSPPAPVPPTGAAPPGAMQAAPDPLKALQDQADDRAKAAEKRIEDWLVESQWHAELRKVIDDCAMLGTGILKGPFPVKRKRKSVKQTPEGMAMVMDVELSPSSKRIDPWNLYPDPACGESIHNGQYILEKDTITVRQLRDLKGIPGYVSESIDKVIEEGPGKKNTGATASRPEVQDDDDAFEIWYYHGIIDKDDLEVMGVDHEGMDMDAIPAIVTLVNDTPIKASLNPLDSGEFPYDIMPWQRRSGQCWGMGVARQIRTPQRMINAGSRNMMDNAGLSGGPQIVVRRNVITPADGTWTLAPRKIWYAREDADIRTVSDALTAINIPSMQAELMNIIQFALKMAEDVTGLPQIMQGQLGKAPDTVGGMQMLANNASTVLRRIARTFDDCITEPHIRRYYEWLMQYGDDKEKGDYTIDARGSSALVERDIANQAIMQLGVIAFNPASGIDTEKYVQELLKSQRLDPKRIMLDDTKKAQLAQQPPPPMPQVEVAKIREQGAMEREKIKANAVLQRAKMDTDRDSIYVQAEMRRDQISAVNRMEELRLKREVAMLEAQVRKGINTDTSKVKLAEAAMKLRVQKELAFASMNSDLHKHHNPTPQVAAPAIEPAGRAPAGQAFQA